MSDATAKFKKSTDSLKNNQNSIAEERRARLESKFGWFFHLIL